MGARSNTAAISTRQAAASTPGSQISTPLPRAVRVRMGTMCSTVWPGS